MPKPNVKNISEMQINLSGTRINAGDVGLFNIER